MLSPPTKQLDHELKIKLNGKKLHQTYSAKYRGIHVDKYLTWKHQINNVAIKLNKGNAMLSKIRHYVNIKTLKSIYLILHWFRHKIYHLLKDDKHILKTYSSFLLVS